MKIKFKLHLSVVIINHIIKKCLHIDTALSLFNIPVVEDEEDYDHIDQIYCDTNK